MPEGGVGGFFKKLNPGHWVREAYDPAQSQEGAAASYASDKQGKAHDKAVDYYNKNNAKFAEAAEVELSHTGSFSKGFAKAALTSTLTGDFTHNEDHRAYHRNVEKIMKNGGSYAEFEQFKKASGDPTKTVSDGATKNPNLKVTIPSYAEFCETTNEKGLQGKERAAAVKDAMQDVTPQNKGGDGKTLKDATKELKKGITADASEQIEQQANPQPDMDRALAQAQSVNTQNVSLRSDNTSLGCPEGNITTGVGGQQTTRELQV